MTENFHIAAFRSRLHVMAFQKLLRGMGVKAEVVTTPRAVALGCGLSVRFEPSELEKARQALRGMPQGNLVGFYSVERDSMGRTVVRPVHSQPRR